MYCARSNKHLRANRGANYLYQVMLIVLLLFIALFFLGGCTQRISDDEQVDPTSKVVIKFSHVTTPESPKGLAAQRWADLVHNRTNGRVEVQVFPDSTLYKDGEEFEALRNGQVQIIAPATSKLADIAPAWQVLDLPYLLNSYQAVHRFVDGPAQDILYQDLRTQGLTPLAFWDNGFKQITNCQRPIIHPKDFAELRFRVMMGSEVLQEQFRCLNADPIPLAFSDVQDAISEHRIDGQENTLSNLRTKQLYQGQTYITISNHGFLGYVVLTEQVFWEGLPRDIRSVLEETLAEVTTWEREQAFRINLREMDDLEKVQTLKVHQQSPEERRTWEQALTPVYTTFTEHVGAELIGFARRAEGGGF